MIYFQNRNVDEGLLQWRFMSKPVPWNAPYYTSRNLNHLGRVINSCCVGLALRSRAFPSCEQDADRSQMDSRQEIAG
ncbi:hypothetical protein, partial [uncultured Thiocystis sp.]|uniref:hypothetical protein n=1 Tax=uncultured Thiocystis sp. TaxID=1202134 RepID=UPI0025D226DA